MGSHTVFDYDTWTWRPATDPELKKQEVADSLRYPEPDPEDLEPVNGIRYVQEEGRKFTVLPAYYGVEVSDDEETLKYIQNSVGGDGDSGFSKQ